ncbi:MAG: hypothetical protein HYZ23_09525 [Chloroflexi bacterium]|nr:hypothetical protein [Chloroflexota bacterium]
MADPIILKSDDPIINRLNFKPYRSMVQRRVIVFLPPDDQPQVMDVLTPWGAKLTAHKGDLLVSEFNAPDDIWPVNPDIFDASYMIIGPGVCVKRAVTLLVPMTDTTDGDDDRMVIVHTLEGVETVRAGDFFLAKGVKGEIWPYPKEKATKIMKPVE